MSIRTFAAIDVGSYELTIKIFEFSGKDSMREIDRVSKRLDLGSDTYASGKISNEKMDELCRTLNDFSDIMKAYKVDRYKAYGTSAIREMENTIIVQDQIAQRTGIKVEILSNSEQRFMDYSPSHPRERASARSLRRGRRSWTSEEAASSCLCLTMTRWCQPRMYGWECCGFRTI